VERAGARHRRSISHTGLPTYQNTGSQTISIHAQTDTGMTCHNSPGCAVIVRLYDQETFTYYMLRYLHLIPTGGIVAQPSWTSLGTVGAGQMRTDMYLGLINQHVAGDTDPCGNPSKGPHTHIGAHPSGTHSSCYNGCDPTIQIAAPTFPSIGLGQSVNTSTDIISS
jgi:hypothetical protein